MRSILFVLFVCFLQVTNAATYYFSAVSGDDSRSYNEAKNSSTPWKSLSKLNSIFSSLQPGDAVLLKRGETFYGSIIVNKSGSTSSPIVIGDYGSGNKPVITSFVKVNNWVSKGNGIWESYNSSFDSRMNIVLLNGSDQELGRYPNSNAAHKGYLHYESVVSNTSITDNNLTSTTNWTGADVVIRARRWILDRSRITSHSGTKINYTASSYYKPYNGQGYFIENSIKTLDKLGEWYYNASTKKLYVFFGSNSPSSYTVQAATKDELIHSEKISNVVFNNLNIMGANVNNISIKEGSNMYVSSCDVNYSGGNGISARYHANFKVENSTISNSHNNGINLGYSGDYAIIRNNKIINTALFPGMLNSGDGSGLAIHSNGNSSIIEYNEVRNTGYIAITFNGNNTLVKNNLVDGFCLTKDDGSGIYSFSSEVFSGRKVIGNIVINGKGESEGTSWTSLIAEGIYMDNNSAGVEISNNTVANCANQGVYLHNAHEITMKNNTIFNSGFRQLAMIEMANHPKIRNCIISSNIFFANYTSLRAQRLVTRISDADDVDLFGRFYSNYYARPLDGNSADYLSSIQSFESYAKLVNFVNPIRFEYNATKQSKTISLDASYTDVKGNKYSGSLTLEPFTSVILIKSSVSFTTSTAPVVSITSPASNSSFTSGTTINISAKATDADGTISKVEFYKGTTLLHTEYGSPYTYSWQNVAAGNYTLTAKATDNSGKVTTSAGVSITVASSTYYPKVSITSPAQSSTYKSGSTINISASASDVDGYIKKVDFYKGTTLLTTEVNAPYSWNWSNVSAGNYTITAKATDNSGHVTTSSSVSISVISSTTSSRPTVNINNNDTAKIELATDEKAESSLIDFSLYPNPAVNTININFDQLQNNQKANLSIQGIAGSVLKSIPLVLSGRTMEVDISSLPPGTYIMRVAGDKFGINKKFIKIK